MAQPGAGYSFEFIRPPDRRSTFHSTLLDANTERIVLTHEIFPSRPLVHGNEEVMDAGYRAVWFLFKGEPFDVGRVYRPDGAWTGFYVDVLEPVHWDGADPTTLHPLRDLFLDLWIAPDGTYRVLDEDEFAHAADEGWISPQEASHARGTLNHLVSRVKLGTFPPEVVRNWEPRAVRHEP